MNDQNVNGDNNEQYMVGGPQDDHDDMQSPEGSPQQDQFEYDEMDLTPYEEDDDATLHKKLCAAKVARKRAEEDLKLLCNRIGLLKMEEGKVSEMVRFVSPPLWLLGGQKNRRNPQTCKPNRVAAPAQRNDLALEGGKNAVTADGRRNEALDEPSNERNHERLSAKCETLGGPEVKDDGPGDQAGEAAD